jgi:hypothetical protein
MIRVSRLFIYPVKSCRGIALDEAEVTATGFAHDREWLVVDRHGVFMTQRDWPGLARVGVSLVPGGIELAAAGMARLEVAAPDPGAPRQRVVIWRDECEAAPAGRDAAQWFSELLGTPCRLVRMPPSTLRQVDLHYAREGDRVAFADGFPFLLLSEASLGELNRRLEKPLPMDRFRPNIVLDGCEPHAEDGWSPSPARGASSPRPTRPPASAAASRCARWPPTVCSMARSCSARTWSTTAPARFGSATSASWPRLPSGSPRPLEALRTGSGRSGRRFAPVAAPAA